MGGGDCVFVFDGGGGAHQDKPQSLSFEAA